MSVIPLLLANLSLIVYSSQHVPDGRIFSTSEMLLINIMLYVNFFYIYLPPHRKKKIELILCLKWLKGSDVRTKYYLGTNYSHSDLKNLNEIVKVIKKI